MSKHQPTCPCATCATIARQAGGELSRDGSVNLSFRVDAVLRGLLASAAERRGLSVVAYCRLALSSPPATLTRDPGADASRAEHPVCVKITHNDRARVISDSQAAGMPLSTWCRAVLLSAVTADGMRPAASTHLPAGASPAEAVSWERLAVRQAAGQDVRQDVMAASDALAAELAAQAGRGEKNATARKHAREAVYGRTRVVSSKTRGASAHAHRGQREPGMVDSIIGDASPERLALLAAYTRWQDIEPLVPVRQPEAPVALSEDDIEF